MEYGSIVENLCMVALAALVAPSSGVLDPYAIFAQARGRWSAESYPALLTYTVTIYGTEKTRIVTNTYSSLVDTTSGKISVQATSAQEAARPFVPHGVSLKARITLSYAGAPSLTAHPSVDGGGVVNVSKTMPLTQPQQYDLLGVPLLSPTYSFGMANASSNEKPAVVTKTPSSAAAGLRTIASVTAAPRDYDIRYDGLEVVDGAPCYHLALTPRHDAELLRLRQLWINVNTLATEQAIIQGNFTEGPGPGLPWLIRFTDDGSRTYIADEEALGVVKYLGHAYSHVSVSFANESSEAGPPGSAHGLAWELSMFRTSEDVLTEP